MTSVRFLVNPAAGRGRGGEQLETLRRRAAEAGADLAESRGSADLVVQARRAAEEGVERLVVAGGDGTVHHAVRGLAETPCTLGIVPLGSGNDLAHVLGVPRDLDAAVRWALEGPVRSIDVGRVRSPAEGPDYFVSYCGVGFDSEVTRFANERVRFLRGSAIYVWAVLRTLAGFQPPSFRIEHDGGVFEGRAMFVTVASSSTLGGGMKIAPEALLDDGLFDLVLVHRMSKLRLLTVFPKVYSGRHVGHPALEFHRTRGARIALDRPMTLHGDGEPLLEVGQDGVEVEMVPRGLQVVGEAG